MVYTYDDTFIINSFSTDELERYETAAIAEVEKLKVTDTYFIERLVINRTYTLACLAQYEAEGMQDKYKVYDKEFKDALSQAMISAKGDDGIIDNNAVYTIAIGRS